jgi:hypothetical protein
MSHFVRHDRKFGSGSGGEAAAVSPRNYRHFEQSEKTRIDCFTLRVSNDERGN